MVRQEFSFPVTGGSSWKVASDRGLGGTGRRTGIVGTILAPFLPTFFSPRHFTIVASRHRYVMQDSSILLLDVSDRQDSHH